MRRWSELIVVNDSREFDIPGDVQLYKDIHRLREAVETADVQGGWLHAISGDARRLSLSVADGLISSLPVTPPGAVSDVLRAWVTHKAKAVSCANALRNRMTVVLPAPDAPLEDWIDCAVIE